MEQEYFQQLRDKFLQQNLNAEEGNMMRAPALSYKGKVFAFFSKDNKMVFKLGKGFDQKNDTIPIREFNPFKNKGPLSGWFEVEYTYHQEWKALTEIAFNLIQT